MTMNLTGPKTIKLSEIKLNLFVRLALNEDHVLMLADLYQHGVAVTPIIVTDKMELVEGRHRYEAMSLLNWTETKALIAKSMSPSETLLEALAANMKGNLPPSANDIQYVVQQLIELGIGTSTLSEQMSRIVPRTLARKYIDVVKKRVERKKIQSVITIILEEGLSVKAAAEKFGLSEGLLRDALGLRKKKASVEMNAVYSAVERRVRGLSHQMVRSSKELLEAYNDGMANDKDVEAFVGRIKTATARLKRTAVNIEERMSSARTNGSGGD